MTISSGVPDATLWVVTVVSVGLFVLRFALLMPSRRFRWRIPLAALMGIVFVLVVATIRDWPAREALGYLSVGFFTFSWLRWARGRASGNGPRSRTKKASRRRSSLAR